MGNTLLVGIGGTGAKAVESFVHLAAAGLGPDKVAITLVDQDAANGNTDLAHKTADLYRKLRTHLRAPDQKHALPKDCPFLRTEIELAPQLTDAVWCPLPGAGMTMRKLYMYGSLRPPLKGLMDVLFDPATEQEMSLQRGFRARPNIGAAVVTTQAHADVGHAFWRQVGDAIASVRNGGEVRIFLVGSIFGGTGASMLPTLAKLIRKLAIDKKVSERVIIGGALLMPYFQFPGDHGDEDGLSADSSNFVAQTKSALNYYPDLMDTGVLDTMYLFGWNSLINVPRRPSGGDKQVNAPLLPDLFSALAAAHFFATPNVQKGRILRADRHGTTKLCWADLPVPGDQPLAVQQKLGQLIRFAVSYLGSYEETLSRGTGRGMLARFVREAWQTNLITDQGIDLNDGEVQQLIGQITAYAKASLAWIGSMVQASRAGGCDSDLIDVGLFSQWNEAEAQQVSVAISTDKKRRKDFAVLVSGGSGPDLDAIYTVLQSIKSKGASVPDGRGLGLFLGCLYQAAGFDDYSKPDAAPADVRLIPNLSSKHGVSSASARRAWGVVGGSDELNTIATALDVSQADAHSSVDAISVPDVWARVELFAIALRDQAHPLHHPLLAEWRGLLACLALTPEHLGNITTHVVSPTALAAQPFDVKVSAQEAKNNFGHTLATMLPRSSALAEASWGNIGLIEMDSAIVGVLAPSVLVCTSRRPIPANDRIGWIRDNRFADPCAMPAEKVSAEELATIAEYCRRLSTAVRQSDTHDGQLREVLINHLDKYSKQALEEASARSLGGMSDNFDAAKLTLATPPGLDMVRECICCLAPDNTQVPSDLRLRLSAMAQAATQQDGQPAKLTAVLLDPAWATTKRFTAQRVWRTIAVESILGNGALCEHVRTEMAASGVLLVTPEMLFTPMLCRITGGIPEHPEGFREFLLPVTPLAMTLFDITAKTVSIRPNGKGFRVGLTLTVIDRRDEATTLTVEKDYAQAEAVDAPEVVRWPNIKNDSLPLNFVYADFQNQGALSVREAVLPQLFLEDCLKEGNPRNRIDRLNRLITNPSGVVDRFMSMNPSPSATGMLFNTAQPAVGVSMDIRADRLPSSGGRGDGVVPAGMVLLPSPQAVEPQDGDWLVGVDFGTTNTCVYVCASNGDPVPLQLRSRAVSPFQSPPRETKIEEYPVFVPSNDLSTPFMTTMWVRSDPMSLDKGLPIYTYTLHNTVHPAGTLKSFTLQGSNLRFDLKWRTLVAGERDPLTDFLRLIVLNVLVEAANAGIAPTRVRWRFSFPQAFHGTKLDNFKAATKNAVKDVLKWLSPGTCEWQSTGEGAVLQQGARRISELAWASEGEASALYFADCMDVRLTGSVVTLDIGGHTTDITVWNNRQLVWRNSVELAGRHLFIDYLTRHLDKLEEVVRGDSDLTSAVREVTSAARQNKGAAVEVVVNSAAFEDKLDTLVRDDHLKAFVEIALAAQLHYLGLVLAYLHRGGKLELRPGNALTLCLSGKVSKLLKAFEHLADASWVPKIIADASKLDIGAVSTRFSQNPKHEVAYGLVVDRTRQRVSELNTDALDRGLVLGESVRVIPPPQLGQGVCVLSPTDSEDETKLPADWLWEAPQELEEFKVFLSQIRRLVGRTLKVGPRAMAEIRAEVEDALSQGRALRQAIKDDNQALSADSTIMAPPFIVAVVALLKRIASHDSDITFVP